MGVHGNQFKGIHLGTGHCDRISLSDNDEHGNHGLPHKLFLPSLAARSQTNNLERRKWAKSVQKSGGSFSKAVAASNAKSPMDAVYTMASRSADERMNKQIIDILACSF